MSRGDPEPIGWTLMRIADALEDLVEVLTPPKEEPKGPSLRLCGASFNAGHPHGVVWCTRLRGHDPVVYLGRTWDHENVRTDARWNDA